VGVGSQYDFEGAREFLISTGVGGADSAITLLWEGSGNIWGMNNVRTNSAMQLFSHDLSQQSGIIFFNNNGRAVVLDASVQEPWAPAGSPNLIG
jgi:hypothetical protein